MPGTKMDCQPQCVDEEAADQRRYHAGGGAGGTPRAQGAAACAGREEVGDDGDAERVYAGGADALQHAADEELAERDGEEADDGARGEDDDADGEESALAQAVAELPVDGREEDEGQHVGGDEEGDGIGVDAEAVADGGQGHAEHLQVQDGHAHGHHEADEDGAQALAGYVGGGLGCFARVLSLGWLVGRFVDGGRRNVTGCALGCRRGLHTGNDSSQGRVERASLCTIALARDAYQQCGRCDGRLPRRGMQGPSGMDSR